MRFALALAAFLAALVYVLLKLRTAFRAERAVAHRSADSGPPPGRTG
jgi:hypothetical protein